MLADMLQRLFDRHLDEAALHRARDGEWLESAWAELVEMGLPLSLLDEGQGGFGLGADDQGELLRLLGGQTVPVPIVETMGANRMLAAAGLAIAEGPAGLADGTGLNLDGGRLTGEIARVAWAEQLDCLAVERDGRLYRIPREGWEIAHGGKNLAGHPRPSISVSWTVADGENASAPHSVLAEGATLRAFQIAGALDKVLALTVDHTSTRVQFGKTLSKFQAVQHELAKLAGEVACANAAADLAAEALARGDVNGVAAGSLRAREAAGLGAAIAIQAHGAIGFTQEHRLHFLTNALWSWRDEFGGQVAWARQLGRAALAAGADGYWPMVTTL